MGSKVSETPPVAHHKSFAEPLKTFMRIKQCRHIISGGYGQELTKAPWSGSFEICSRVIA